jgi:hypothetical protein
MLSPGIPRTQASKQEVGPGSAIIASDVSYVCTNSASSSNFANQANKPSHELLACCHGCLGDVTNADQFGALSALGLSLSTSPLFIVSIEKYVLNQNKGAPS